MRDKDLKKYQRDSAVQIANRYVRFMEKRPKDTYIPFFQSLSAITGSGKTAILCYAMQIIFEGYRKNKVPLPLVLWTTKSRVIVEQTARQLRSEDGVGGLLKASNIGIFALNELKENLVNATEAPCIVVATLASFHRGKSAGRERLRVHRKTGNNYEVSNSTWKLLQKRAGRHLLVVYDEGHNFNVNQDATLKELAPDGYLLSSGTAGDLKKSPLAFREKSEKVLEQAANVLGGIWPQERRDDLLTTRVTSMDAVREGLVKKTIHLYGTNLSMEGCVDLVLKKIKALQKAAENVQANFRPKAIYVCNTNLSSSGEKDNRDTPFKLRKGRAIVLWRYLAQQCNIPSDEIAIYANVRADQKTFPRQEFHLFHGGEADYTAFVNGDFKHIIFNLALQEGWDDPTCYVAYIDKTMKAKVQIRQVIGRVLRQPQGRIYESEMLNTAHFYVRVDHFAVFKQVVDELRKEMEAEDLGGIQIEDIYIPDNERIKKTTLEPKVCVKLPKLSVNSEEVREDILNCYKKAIEDLLGDNGKRILSEAEMEQRTIHVGGKRRHVKNKQPKKLSAPSTKYSIRWATEVLGARIDKRVSDILDYREGLPKKAEDYCIGIDSRAWISLEETMKKMAEMFYARSQFDSNSGEDDVFRFRTIDVLNGQSFKNGLYEKYGTMNKLEEEFAVALDAALNKTDCYWHRNTPKSGYALPLLLEGKNQFVYPDFLAWRNPTSGKSVSRLICIDTKGTHLLKDALDTIKSFRKNKAYILFYLLSKEQEKADSPPKYKLWERPEQGDPKPQVFENLERVLEFLLRDLKRAE